KDTTLIKDESNLSNKNEMCCRARYTREHRWTFLEDSSLLIRWTASRRPFI
ncbi:hypothetical protein CEXT_705391, partial [Caerostris extrusa]